MRNFFCLFSQPFSSQNHSSARRAHPPFSPTPAGAGKAPPHSPAPSNQNAASHPILHHFPSPSPKGERQGEAAQQRRRGQQRYAEYHFRSTKANSYKLPAAPLGGSAAKRQRGCRWYFFEPSPFNEPHPLSQPLRAASSPIGEPSPTAPERGGGPRVSVAEGFAVRRTQIGTQRGEFVLSKANILRIRPGFDKSVRAYRNPSAAAAAAQLCIKRLYAVKDGYTR